MIPILNVTTPFFALVLCGYLAARYGMLPDSTVPALNTFVLYFALPCMLFRFASGTPFRNIVNIPVFLAYMVAGLVVLGLFAGAMRFVVGESVCDSAFTALAASWSNWGYMGIPLIPALLGQAALAPLIAAGMADVLVVTSAALALASRRNQTGDGVHAALTGALMHVVRNSLAWAVITGGTFSALGLHLPAPMDQFTRLLGEAAGPVALFTIGVSLYRPSTPAWRVEVLLVAAAKLALHPFLVGVVTIFVFRLTQLEVHTLILAAALPVAGTVFLFAEREGANAERIAAAILVSTAFAFVTFSTLCWVLGVQLPS